MREKVNKSNPIPNIRKPNFSHTKNVFGWTVRYVSTFPSKYSTTSTIVSAIYWPIVGHQPLFDRSTQSMEEDLKGRICKLGLRCAVRLWETLCCADFLSDSCSEVLKSKCTQWAKVSAKGPPSKGGKFVEMLVLNFFFGRIEWFSKLIWCKGPETWWINNAFLVGNL